LIQGGFIIFAFSLFQFALGHNIDCPELYRLRLLLARFQEPHRNSLAGSVPALLHDAEVRLELSPQFMAVNIAELSTNHRRPFGNAALEVSLENSLEDDTPSWTSRIGSKLSSPFSCILSSSAMTIMMHTLAISGSLECRAPQIAFGIMNALSNREIIIFSITVFRFWESRPV
jgi:hypothetical protein